MAYGVFLNLWRAPVTVIVGPSPSQELAFAIIADLHIGWGYSDYGTVGYDDPDISATQDYWLTLRLEKVVEKIIDTKEIHKIKFVVVLGDIADTAEKSEFLKAREILSELNDPNGDKDTSDGIPYIPLIGNHDVWPYTMKQGTDPDKRDEKYVDASVDKTHYNPDNLGDRYFQKIFWEDDESKNNRDLITRVFGSSWTKQTHTGAPYLQNYKFTFGNMDFICLDFNPRDPDMAFPGSKAGALVQPFYDTWNWFYQFLRMNKDKNIIVFSHHPMSLEGGFNTPPRYLVDHLLYVDICKDIIREFNVTIFNFGGHTHVNDISSSAIAKYVIETEALFQESAEVIRIVKVNGQQINYNTLDGVANNDPGLSLFFAFSPGNPSNDQNIHFVSRPVDFKENSRINERTYMLATTALFTWNFGDGTEREGWGNPIPYMGEDDPSHSYEYAGVYHVSLQVNTSEGTVEIYGYPIIIGGVLSPMYYIRGLPENFQAVSTGRGVSVTEEGDGQNTFETVLITKTASPETPIVEFGVHFDNATEDIDLSTFVADVNITERKAFFYMPSWPEVIEEPKTLYIPSTGIGAVYVCFDAKSLDEVSFENADMVIHVGESVNGITVTTTYYNDAEYYLVYGLNGTGVGEPSTYILTITTTTGGMTDPHPGIYNYTSGTMLNVTAIPDAGYSFNLWIFDSQIRTENPIAIIIDSSYTLTAYFIDNIPPEISEPWQDPPLENVQPFQNVTVWVNVTDYGSGIKNVTLWYSIDNGASWTILNMTALPIPSDTRIIYEATIRGYENCTWVTYKIIAYDNAGNNATKDNNGYGYQYHVIPEFPSTSIFILLMLTTLIATTLWETKRKRQPP
jgi:hypothetical protein